MATDSPKYGYLMGPNDAMKQELGQIVVNHANCESAIFTLFISLLGIPEKNARILVKSQNMKAPAMIKTLKDLINSNSIDILPEFKNRIFAAFEIFKKSSEKRNMFAHWQWEATTEPFANLINDLNTIDPINISTKQISILDLKETAFELACIYVELMIISHLIGCAAPLAMTNEALQKHDKLIAKVKESLQNAPLFLDED